VKIWRCDLTKQIDPILEDLMEVTRQVLITGKYVLGERLAAFEKQFADYCNVPYCVGVASGTEALYLALLAYDIKAGDEVITTPFTAIPTFSAILMVGATPVFVDIDPNTYNLDANRIESKITVKTKAIMPVHLFGQMADMDVICKIGKKSHIPIIEDAAQAHGSTYNGKMAGTIGDIGCYSFYPTKNLGAIGDAGAIIIHDESIYNHLKLLRNYGQESLYRTVINGVNSRLDELQAAYLSLKLKYLNEWNSNRRKLAKIYAEHLPKEFITIPHELQNTVQNYHIYVVRAKHRDKLQLYLDSQNIQTNVYYPVPLHLQKSNMFLKYKHGDFPESEKACQEVLALPMYPELAPETVIHISEIIKAFYRSPNIL
jgi:dTDP-4-amino-4,6-dideoxygalactose transaminase